MIRAFKNLKFFSSKVGGVLYIPSNKLNFINHEKYGKVCPIYIADNEYNRKNNPKKIMPAMLFFSGLNLYFLLTGWGYIPVKELYRIFYFNDYIFYFSFAMNFLFARKYLKYLADYQNRVKNFFLLPEGEKCIIETFEGSTYRLNNLDIYERQVVSKTNQNSIFINNDNSFFARICWGAGKEHIFKGKIIYLNYDIFNSIVHRYKIDTSQSRFIESPLKFWTKEEKLKILKKYRIRRIPEKLKINSSYYYFLKKKYFSKKQKRDIKKEFQFYSI